MVCGSEVDERTGVDDGYYTNYARLPVTQNKLYAYTSAYEAVVRPYTPILRTAASGSGRQVAKDHLFAVISSMVDYT